MGAKPQMLDIGLAEQMPFKVFKQNRVAFHNLAVKQIGPGKACNISIVVCSTKPTALFWKFFTNGK